MSQRPRAVLVTQYWQMLPPAGPDPACDAPEAMRAWLTAVHELPPGATDWREAIAAGLVPGPHTAGPDDLAMLPYTSGTTGLPKGCVHTNATLMANSAAAASGAMPARNRWDWRWCRCSTSPARSTGCWAPCSSA